MGFCDEQRQRHAELWSRVTNHRLIDQLVDNTIPRRVLARYLAQDHRFLDAFVVLLASIIARARCLADRIPGCQLIASFTDRDYTYFERSLDALGDEAVIAMEAPDGPATIGFCALMRETAYSSDLASMLAVLVVAEWSYQDWGERVLPLLDDKIDVPFWCREWVEMHSGPYFGSVVTYLRKLLDDEATRLSATSDGDASLEGAATAFAKALQLELDFFEQAYDSGSS
jgi:thiaminase/transcriptional activator TenA